MREVLFLDVAGDVLCRVSSEVTVVVVEDVVVGALGHSSTTSDPEPTKHAFMIFRNDKLSSHLHWVEETTI